ncbi:transmembrane protein 200B [Conger conger]|uniref:transmembrane protein 200B n=1 Tax=Conger conger TaxID=82655 RepID=UPI002A5AFF28|nr:transmembrane protein 200B [Conger conger]
MTATGAARAGGPQGPPPSRRGLARFRFRPRKRKEGPVRARLRIRSSPGAFLLLGVFVVTLGVVLAAVGYWPYRTALLGQVGVDVDLGQPQVAGWGLGARGGPLSSERLKLLGPVLMGVGLFILICANSVLYENRDRETRRLLAEAQAAVCSVSAAVPVEAPPGRAVPKHYRWVTSLPTGNLGLRHLGVLVGSEPALLRLQAAESKWAEVRCPASLWADVGPFKKSSSPPISLRSVCSDSCSSNELNLTVLTTASLMSPPPDVDPCEVTPPPRRCYSVGSRTEPRPERGGVLRQASSPHVCLNVPDLQTWTLGEDKASSKPSVHCSWPRLDLSGARRYLKLENKEDSVDRLLDQLEQQYSRQETSYGSGPFQ